MTNRIRMHTRTVSILLSVIGVIAIMVFGLGQRRVKASDEAAIQEVIEAAYPAEIEACLYGNHSSIQDHKDALIPYFSDATRTPSELSTRTSRENAIFPTSDSAALATNEAEAIALATANPTMMPGDKLTAITGYVDPTPHWRAADSMLDERWRSIDTCQSVYGFSNVGQMAHAFEVTGYDYRDISIDGDFADVDVLIEGWTEWLPNGAGRDTGTDHYYFRLEKVGGDWKIINESVSMRE